MKLFIASDHAGFKLKNSIRKRLKKENVEVEDLGAFSAEGKVDFPDYAFALGKKSSLKTRVEDSRKNHYAGGGI